MIRKVFRGSTDKIKFQLTDCDTGDFLDITGMIISARLCYAGTQEFLTQGFSSGAKFPGEIEIITAGEGICEIQFSPRHTQTAVSGLLDLHVEAELPGATLKVHKDVRENFIELRNHFV